MRKRAHEALQARPVDEGEGQFLVRKKRLCCAPHIRHHF